MNSNKIPKISYETIVDFDFQKLMDIAPTGMYLIQDGIFCYCNKKFAEIIGYNEDEIINKKSIRDLAFPADWPRVEENFISFLKSDSESEHELLRIVRKDKSIIFVKIFGAKSVYDGRLAVFGTLIDVTEERNASEQFNILAHAIKSAGECVVITDLDHRIIYVNETLCNIFGYTAEELYGKYLGIFHEGCVQSSEFQRILEATYQNGWQGEILSRKKDGKIFPILLSTTLVRDHNNKPLAIVGFSQDISKRKRIVEKLDKSERKVRTLIDKMPDGLVYLKIIYNSDGQPTDFEVVQVNESFKKILKIENIDAVGKTVSSQLDKLRDVEFDFIKHFAEACIKRTEEKYEVYSKRLDKYYSISVYSPEENHLVAIVQDVTIRKKTEQEIIASKHMLRTILDNIPQRVFWKDKNSVFQGCNVHFAKDLGFENPEDLIGKTDFDVDYENLAKDFISCDRYVMDNDDPLIIDSEKHLKQDGSKFWIRLNKVPLKNENNKIIGVVGTYEDISRQKIAEDNIRKLSQAVEQSPASIVITDLNGNIEYVNAKFTRLTGYSLHEVIGKNPRILKSGDMTVEAYKDMWNTISSGNEWVGEFHNRKKNGEYYWEYASVSPIKDSDGKITHFLAVKEDITPKKNYEEELKNAKEKAEELNRLKSIFLANISHELRTPLIGIIGYAETLINDITNQDQKEMAKTLLKSGLRLKETLGSILNLSHIEANSLKVNLKKLNLTNILRDKLKEFHSFAEEKGLKLQMILNDEDLEINADEKMLSDAFEHLLANAIKYTSKGKVTVSISKIVYENKNYAEIKVTDTGIGISKQNIQLIFEPFRQVSEGFSRLFEGIGLGLTVVKKFISLMNGDIFVESEVGQGSEFTIRFPLLPSNNNTQKSFFEGTSIINKLGYKYSSEVLLIEDDDPSATIVKFYLGETCRVDRASDGKTAVEMARTKRYSALLVDINLGADMNGIETITIIKQLPGYELVPVIAVTAYAMYGDREEFLNLGCNDYLSKPFDKKEIVSKLEQYLNTAQQITNPN